MLVRAQLLGLSLVLQVAEARQLEMLPPPRKRKRRRRRRARVNLTTIWDSVSILYGTWRDERSRHFPFYLIQVCSIRKFEALA